MVYENIPTYMLFCIVVVVKLSRFQEACDSGWFGEKCRFRCHCFRSPTCDMKGDCPSDDKCATGFFGPGCQYVDLAVRSTNDTDEYLIDENEATCNDKSTTSVRISWIEGVIFNWLRIYVSSPADNLHNVTVTLNNNVDCPNKKTFTFSSTAVDVTCDFLSKVFTLDVVGAVAANICSVYISGGRNVALRQPTNQTSVYFNDTASRSSNAVDGDTNPCLEDGHCSHTLREPEMAEWSIFFSRPCTIFEIILYNRDRNRLRLGYFTLLAYDDAGRQVVSYFEEREPGLPTYDIQSPTREHVAVISIRLTSGDDKILTLCEVEIFGEVVCADDYYGLSCQNKCTCQGREECSTVTGACRPGCPHGRYESNCSKYCDSNCRHLKCSQRTGACLTCHSGYRGQECSSECAFGTFGISCQKKCSENCLSPCDINDGFCECQAPYVGRSCTECPPSLYGDNCTEKCPRFCASELCHSQTGDCISCYGARIGARCEDCPPGLYGPLCLELCSKYCYNDTCDANSGTCFSCTHDYSGPKCTVAPTSISVIHLLVAVGLSALISFIGACFVLRKAQIDERGDAEIYGENDAL